MMQRSNHEVDGRLLRSERTRKAIRAAVERLRRGEGNHPRHAGLTIPLTKAAIAREARVDVSTLYRYPTLLAEIDSAPSTASVRTAKASVQRRNKLVNRIDALNRDLNAALQENLRLSRILAKYDPTLGIPQPTSLSEKRISSKSAVRPAR
jgi:hypothetical protein